MPLNGAKKPEMTYHAAGMSRRQVQNVPKCSKMLRFLEFHDHIWNHHEKCIQISTSMPGIGSLIREIHINISEIWESKNAFNHEINAHLLSRYGLKVTSNCNYTYNSYYYNTQWLFTVEQTYRYAQTAGRSTVERCRLVNGIVINTIKRTMLR